MLSVLALVAGRPEFLQCAKAMRRVVLFQTFACVTMLRVLCELFGIGLLPVFSFVETIDTRVAFAGFVDLQRIPFTAIGLSRLQRVPAIWHFGNAVWCLFCFI